MVHLPFLKLTERVFGSHPHRIVSISYGRGAPFHGDALRTSRTQILPDLAASEAKHEASTAINTDTANQWPSIGPHADPRGATRAADHADKIRSNCRDLTVK